jgi:hypothetical protein
MSSLRRVFLTLFGWRSQSRKKEITVYWQKVIFIDDIFEKLALALSGGLLQKCIGCSYDY